VSKHPKFCSKLQRLRFPFRGQKNPSAEHHLYSASQIRVSGARNLPTSHRLSTGFSASPFANIASRTADESISIKTSCKSFFNYFLMPLKNHPKAHEIRLIPIRAPSNHLRPTLNNDPARAKKSSALLHENVSHPFPQRPKCFPETK
jgi:hypothetical protein